MKRVIELVNYFIYLLLCFYLIIDTFTGYFLNNGMNISVSVPYKLVIIFLMIIVILNYSPYSVMQIIPILLLLLISVYFYSSNGYTKNSANIVQDYIKTLSPIVFYMYFSSISKRNIYENRMEKVIFINLIVFLFNMFIGILGLGYHTYSYGVGIKGFFYAGNEIFLIIVSIMMIYVKKTGSRTKRFFYLIVLISTLLIGTKTAFLSVLLIMIYDTYKFGNFKTKFRIIFFICVSIVLVVSLFNVILMNISTVENVYYNITTNLQKKDSILLDVVLSGRIGYLRRNVDEWKSTYSISQLLLGGGNFFRNKATEIDVLDSFFLHGLLYTIVISLFYIYLVVKAARKRNYTLVVFDILIIVISETAGHIWPNLTGGIFFIMANFYSFDLNRMLKRYNFYIPKIVLY